MEVTPPKQADLESRKIQQSMINTEPTVLELHNGKKVKIGWIYPPTSDKIDDVINEHDDIAKAIEAGSINTATANKKTRQYFAKIAAAILLNGKTRLFLFWWIKWRIIYYRWNLTGDDYLRIIVEAKKKSGGTGVLSGYGILDDYGRYLDDDDEKRSRSIPSRTKIGKRAAVIEKFPFLGQPLSLFGGLITIPFWVYDHTPIALMEVMMADLPHVEYIDPEKITSEDIHKAEEKSKKIAARTKAKGLGVNLSNQVGLQNAKGFMHQIQRGHK